MNPREITLIVSKSQHAGYYTIGNKDLVLQTIGRVEVRNRYIIPDHHFRFDDKPTHRDGSTKIYDFDDLLFSLKRAVGYCSDYYRLTGIRVKILFADDIPTSIRRRSAHLVQQINAYMDFIDDINQYESQPT